MEIVLTPSMYSQDSPEPPHPRPNTLQGRGQRTQVFIISHRTRGLVAMFARHISTIPFPKQSAVEISLALRQK